MTKKSSLIIGAIMLIALLISCAPAEPPINMTLETFDKTVEERTWSSDPNYNNMNESEKAKFKTDLAAQDVWTRTEDEAFTMVNKDNPDFMISQDSLGKWISVYKGKSMVLSKGMDPYTRSTLYNAFLSIVEESAWERNINFNEMTAEEKILFDTGLAESAEWKKPETEGEEFILIHKTETLELHQAKNGEWWKILNGNKSVLTTGESIMKEALVFSDLVKALESKEWPKDIGFQSMDRLELEQIKKDSESTPWNFDTHKVLGNFIAHDDHPGLILTQNIDGSWKTSGYTKSSYSVSYDLEKGAEWVFDPDAEKYASDNYYYRKITIGGKEGWEINRVRRESNSEVIIPDTYKGFPVISIDGGLWYNNTNIKTLKLGNNLEKIGHNAFIYCSNLESIEFGTSNLSLQNGVFQGTKKVNSLVIPANVTLEGNGIFSSWTDQQQITVSKDVVLTDLENPIGWLSGCSAKIIWEGDVIPEGLSIGSVSNCKNLVINGWSGTATTLDLFEPIMVHGIPVTGIDGAFRGNKSITEIKIGNHYTWVDIMEFGEWTADQKIILEKNTDFTTWDDRWNDESHAVIDYSASMTKDNFYVVDMPDGTIKLAKSFNTDDKNLVIPQTINEKTVSEIGRQAFKSHMLSEIVIPEGVKTIADMAFLSCNAVTKIVLPSTLTYIGWQPFAMYNVTNQTVTIPASVTYVGGSAFCHWDNSNTIRVETGADTSKWSEGWNDYSEAIFIENAAADSEYGWRLLDDGTVTITGYQPVSPKSDLSIPGIIKGKTVSSIEHGAFSGKTEISSVLIPASITAIKGNPFIACTGLENIVVEEGNTAYMSVTGSLIEKDTKKLVSGSRNFTIPADGSVTQFDRWACHAMKIPYITIPNIVTDIPEEFYQDIGSSILRLEKGSTVTLPDGWSNPNSWHVWEKPVVLMNWTEGSNLGWIEKEGNIYLTGMDQSKGRVVIPEEIEVEPGVKKPLFGIVTKAFYHNMDITEIVFPANLKVIEGRAFEMKNNKNIPKVIIPNTIEIIGYHGINVPTDTEVYVEEGVDFSKFDRSFTTGKVIAHWHKESDWLYSLNGNIATVHGHLNPSADLTIPYDLGNGTHVEHIAAGTFRDDYGIINLVISDGIKTIGNNALYNAQTLKTLLLPSSLTSIGENVLRSIPPKTIYICMSVSRFNEINHSTCNEMDDKYIFNYDPSAVKP